jgi:hypothetical protein
MLVDFFTALFRFSPATVVASISTIAELAIADATSDTVPLKQTSAALLGALLVETTVRRCMSCVVLLRWAGQC